MNEDYWREVAQTLDAHDLSSMPPATVRGLLRCYLAGESGEADLSPSIRYCPDCGATVAGITAGEANHFARIHCPPENWTLGGGGWSARNRVSVPRGTTL